MLILFFLNYNSIIFISHFKVLPKFSGNFLRCILLTIPHFSHVHLVCHFSLITTTFGALKCYHLVIQKSYGVLHRNADNRSLYYHLMSGVTENHWLLYFSVLFINKIMSYTKSFLPLKINFYTALFPSIYVLYIIVYIIYRHIYILNTYKCI